MADAADDTTARMKKGQRQFMIGAGLVMAGMIFGGGLAMVCYFLNQRTIGMVAGLGGAAVVATGIYLQARGARILRRKAP